MKIEPKMATALYGRGLAELKKGNSAAGNADIATAKATNPNIATEFALWNKVRAALHHDIDRSCLGRHENQI